MWQIKVIAILILQVQYSLSFEQCCPNAEWLGGFNCTDGTVIHLSCPGGMYKLDPHKFPTTDNFTIVKEELQIAENIERTESHLFCLTTDKGSPIALVCFEDVPSYPSYPSNQWRYILFGTLCVLSALFLYVTLAVYATIPELRDLQGKILMSAMSSLFGAYIFLGTVQLSPDYFIDHDTACTWLAFLLYYCFMAAFFWMNLVALNVWRSVWFHKSVFTEDALYLMYSLIGWGAPIIFLAFAIMGQHQIGKIMSPGFGLYNCWFAGAEETWIFLYGPVACLMSLNVLYFSLTCYELWHKYRNFSGTRLRILRFKCLLYLKLLLVMGLTWIFEVLSFVTGSDWVHYWIVTDALNSLQGLIIFVLLIVTRKRVRKLLAKKKPFGINFPKSWIAGEDEECEIELPDEELELSQAG